MIKSKGSEGREIGCYFEARYLQLLRQSFLQRIVILLQKKSMQVVMMDMSKKIFAKAVGETKKEAVYIGYGGVHIKEFFVNLGELYMTAKIDEET